MTDDEKRELKLHLQYQGFYEWLTRYGLTKPFNHPDAIYGTVLIRFPDGRKRPADRGAAK